MRVCEIRGCLFIATMPLSYCIRPQTFVMIIVLVCCTAGFSLGLRDLLVSSMNEDIPQQPPICRPFYNTQERDTHLLLNTRHAPAHLKLFFPSTLGCIWTSNWSLSSMNIITISDGNTIQFGNSYLMEHEYMNEIKYMNTKRLLIDQELKERIFSSLNLHVWHSSCIIFYHHLFNLISH